MTLATLLHGLAPLSRLGILFVLLVPCSQTKSLCADVIQETVTVDIRLPTTDGRAIQLSSVSDASLRVVCFLGCECPLAKLYSSKLEVLSREFSNRDVSFIGINSNPQDTMEELKRSATDHSLSFPMAKDHDSTVAIAFNATRTPEVFVFDSLGTIVYRGRIDDQYRPGVIQNHATRQDLREAISDYLTTKTVSIARTEAAGCLIAKPRKVDPLCDVTYCGQVAAILQKHCVECHREGEIGPFSMNDYEDVVGWADMMLETIDQERMPPWHATGDHELLINARHMPTQDRDVLHRWIKGGLPFGDAKQLPSPPNYTTGWQLERIPDLVLDIQSKPFRIVPDGEIEYQYFVVDPKFEEDKWVQAAEILPGNGSVVHHVIAFIRPPDGQDLSGLGMLTAYVPGQRISPAMEGLAKRIPAGSKLVFQMHYTPTGTEQTDLSRLGLVFVDKSEVRDEITTLAGINHRLEIPPGQANVTVEGESSRLPRNGRLLSVAPHMHLRGKAVTIGVKKGEETRTLVEIPRYDFNWQHTYLFKDPIVLADVESIVFSATFDNSPNNPFNPDPNQFVTWGDQTWEEMAVVFYEIAEPLQMVAPGPTGEATVNIDTPVMDDNELFSPTQLKEADNLMRDLDLNQDGIIDYEESATVVKWRLFRTIDVNRDQKIDRDEALQYVKKIVH